MTTRSTRQATGLTAAVAAEIRAWLGRRNWSQAKLARTLGQSQMWMSDRLQGKQDIGLTDLERIAAALEVDVADLLPRGMIGRNDSSVVPVPMHAPDVRPPTVNGTRRRPRARVIAPAVA